MDCLHRTRALAELITTPGPRPIAIRRGKFRIFLDRYMCLVNKAFVPKEDAPRYPGLFPSAECPGRLWSNERVAFESEGAELGDYESRRHPPGYVSEFALLPHQSPELEARAAEIHRTLTGVSPAQAELSYLDKVKWLDMYGVDLHPVLGEDSVDYFLGLAPSGLLLLRGKHTVANYYWPRVSKLYYKGRYFMLRVADKTRSVTPLISAADVFRDRRFTAAFCTLYHREEFLYSHQQYMVYQRITESKVQAETIDTPSVAPSARRVN
ncbi:Band 4.1-like protein 4A [Eumeta japonica]|uniref:Band 4.1-like protein 4A n=1 Tax=Eumeta variegata TaxID=151549 RepID=A0A4C1ZKK3_EUMVA|nr:Band 4.1-like protein 4A [Eumeta japonica]